MSLATTLTQSDQNHPPLVLIHGLGSAATAFKPIIPALAQSFRVITVDLPGHGNSTYSKLWIPNHWAEQSLRALRVIME